MITEINLENLTEQRYLELSEQMKEIVEEKDQELLRNRRELAETRRAMMSVYGLVDYVRTIVDGIDLEGIVKIDLEDMLQCCVSKLEKIILP